MNLNALRLDKADALLRQSGVALSSVQEVGAVTYLQSVLDALCELSSTDALTGLMNRRAFMAALENEADRVARAGDAALLLALDIDHFKRVNDEHGHPVGDLVLQAVAQRMREQIRPMDQLARLGGEEFALLCPNCPPSFAATLAERLRSAVACQAIAVGPGLALPVTVSVGGAFALPWVKVQISAWLQRADEHLYDAKRSGRNRVCIEPVQHFDVSPEEKRSLFNWDTLPADAAASDHA